MAWLNNLRLRWKLLGSFGVVCLLMGMVESLADLRGALLADQQKDTDDALADVAKASSQHGDAFAQYTSRARSPDEIKLVTE
jgi:hypothetical protein